jgi:hypothetical protein
MGNFSPPIALSIQRRSRTYGDRLILLTGFARLVVLLQSVLRLAASQDLDPDFLDRGEINCSHRVSGVCLRTTDEFGFRS